ncbi:hypothetical protein F511_26930 [Dorcoceras hygrometricum]|uniref:Uncharacterized protein n=1 Tax=Dorcoceras hygrometricum TaxID=472368 RepID=A0A2Z7D9D7_9LAMI|nr:hypothetical protein F511_26930 [Dorcoceras hygrometricum]
MAAPHRGHVCARDCALAGQGPTTSGRDMQLFRVSDCALVALTSRLDAPPAGRCPVKRRAADGCYRASIARMVACWLPRSSALVAHGPRSWARDVAHVYIAIGSLATLDLPMVVDLIGIYVLKGPYCMLTTTNWFLQALSVIHMGSWHDVARPKKPPPPPLKPHAAAALRRRVPPPSAARFVIGLVSITTTSLKCRFPRETGRSQAPRRQQESKKQKFCESATGTAACGGAAARAHARVRQYVRPARSCRELAAFSHGGRPISLIRAQVVRSGDRPEDAGVHAWMRARFRDVARMRC